MAPHKRQRRRYARQERDKPFHAAFRSMYSPFRYNLLIQIFHARSAYWAFNQQNSSACAPFAVQARRQKTWAGRQGGKRCCHSAYTTANADPRRASALPMPLA